MQPYVPGGDPILGGHGFPPFGEDCLTLNLWTPGADDAARPVLVWIHGGGFLTGSGNLPYYAGDTFAHDGDLVTVTINYRVGALGFLDMGAGANLWLSDQVAAMRWIVDNVAAFGGDPGRITVAGQSGGALSVAALAGHPETAGLFQRAILQSPPLGVRLHDGETATARRALLAEVLGHTDPGELRAESGERLVKGTIGVLMRKAQFGEWGLAFTPVLDAATIPRPPSESLLHSDVDVLLGWTHDEGTFRVGTDPIHRACTREQVVAWAVKKHGARAEAIVDGYLTPAGARPVDALVGLLTDDLFRADCIALADARAQSRPVYAYQFEVRSRAYDGALAATHCLEIPFVFANRGRWAGAPFLVGMPEEVVRTVSAALHPSWIRFVRDGDPTHWGLPVWTRHSAEARETLVITDQGARVTLDPAAPWLAFRHDPST